MVGSVAVGGGAPVAVQSMTNTDTRDAQATLAQIARLEEAGCEIVRVAIPHADALDGFEAVCAASPLPVVADIHFDHRLAIEAARRGARSALSSASTRSSTRRGRQPSPCASA
jgi:(E)-4-hydroxy-3-methylbut-2-enyl-diphosphate synthase